MALADHEAELLGWLEQQQGPMIELLGQLVNTDSGSFDAKGWRGPVRSSRPICTSAACRWS